MKKLYKTNWLFKLKSSAMLAAMLFAGTAMAQLSGTYTVNPSGSGTTNFTSFTALSTALANGVSGAVTVNVAAGTYTGKFTLNAIANASATNTITINGNGATLSSANAEAVIDFNGADYVTINNLIISSGGNANGARGIWFHNASDYNTISNCQILFTANTSTGNGTAYVAFTNTATGNAAANHGQFNVIRNNVMRGSSNSVGPYYGFLDFRSSTQQNLTVANEFTNNEVRDVFFYYTFFNFTNGIRVEGNDFHTSRSGASNVWGLYANYCKTTTHRITISNNKIRNLKGTNVYASYLFFTEGTSALPMRFNDNKYTNNSASSNLWGNRIYYANFSQINRNEMAYNDCGSYMYYFMLALYCNNAEIMNNIYHNNYGSFGELYNLYVGYGNNTKVAHNTIAMGDVSGGYYFYAWYVFNTAAYTNFEFKNNILTCTTNPGFGYAYPVYCSENVAYAGNVINITGTYTMYNYVGNTAYGTIAAWAAAMPTGAVVVADPQFTNLGTGNLRPRNPRIANIGATGLAATDYVGANRTACGPDPGAYEFFVDHSVSNATSLPSSECGGYNPTLGVTFTNGTNVAMTNVPKFYSINGNRVTENIASVGANASVNYTFNSKPVFNTPGVNTVVIGLSCDDDASNNTTTQTITIIPSPSGANLVQGSTWNGYFRTGNMADPDVTVPDYEVVYNVQSPSKYTTAGLGSDWTIANNSTIVGGAAIGTAEGITVSGNAGTVTVDPAASLQGKTLYVSVVITDVNTGCDSAIGRYMYVPYTPVVDFQETDICLGDVAQFKNKSTLAGPDYMLNTWEFDDPDPAVTDDNSEIQDGFWDYTKYGTADVTLTVVNGKYPLFEYSVTKTVTVTPKPVVDFKVLNKCFGTPVEFNNTTAMPNGTTTGITYAWTFGDGGTSTAEDPKRNYATPGQRVVTLVATANGCSSTVSKNAYQFEMPTANFTSKGVCNFEEIEFTNSSTIPNGAKMGYAWDFGDGNIARNEDPRHAFSTPGVKTIKLKTTSEFGCENTVSKTITLNESPEANFTWDKACNLTPIKFTRTGSVPNGGANTSYTWNFDNAGASSVENPEYLFSKVGTKKVTLTAADLNGCKSTITKEVPVVLQAVAAFEASSVCEGDEAVFTNKSTVAAGNLEYLWKFGDGTTSTDLSPKHRYAITGTTQIIGVTLEAIVPGGCSDQITKSITVNAAPDASFTPNVQGRTVAFDGPSGNSIYQWRFGDGSKATTEDPIYTYNNVDQGTFEVCLATKNAECWSETCETITINLVGVEELAVNNEMITVYPNPNNGSFNLTIENAQEDAVIKVGDILGSAIPATVVNNLNGKYSVDLSAVAAGVYFVQVKNGNYYATKRITVSR